MYRHDFRVQDKTETLKSNPYIWFLSVRWQMSFCSALPESSAPHLKGVFHKSNKQDSNPVETVKTVLRIDELNPTPVRLDLLPLVMFLRTLTLQEHYVVSRSHPFRLARRVWVYFSGSIGRSASNAGAIFKMIHLGAPVVMGTPLYEFLDQSHVEVVVSHKKEDP